jgi:hypothetical protein
MPQLQPATPALSEEDQGIVANGTGAGAVRPLLCWRAHDLTIPLFARAKLAAEAPQQHSNVQSPDLPRRLHAHYTRNLGPVGRVRGLRGLGWAIYGCMAGCPSVRRPI